MPYYFENKFFENDKKFSVKYWEKHGFKLKGYVLIGYFKDYYCMTNHGLVPLSDSIYSLKEYKGEISFPKYDKIMEIIKETDNYYINY